MSSIVPTDPGLSRRLIHREENSYVHSKGYRKIALEISGRDSRAMRLCGVPSCPIDTAGQTRAFAVGRHSEAAGAGNAAGVGGERVARPDETVAAEQPSSQRQIGKVLLSTRVFRAKPLRRQLRQPRTKRPSIFSTVPQSTWVSTPTTRTTLTTPLLA